MDTKLEAVVVPVSDVDRSRHFYRALGFRLDTDEASGNGLRVVKLTPPGSRCSIFIGIGITSAAPGSFHAVLTVSDLEAARAELLARGVTPQVECGSGFHSMTFTDPDGNQWLVAHGVPVP